jgi:hypothetical protein
MIDAPLEVTVRGGVYDRHAEEVTRETVPAVE